MPTISIGDVTVSVEVSDVVESWRIKQHKAVPDITLVGAINASVTTLTVSSAADIVGGDQILIDNEAINVTSKVGAVLTVVRARVGTVGATHATGANVEVCKYPTAVALCRAFIRDKVVELMRAQKPATITAQEAAIATAQAAIKTFEDSSVV